MRISRIFRLAAAAWVACVAAPLAGQNAPEHWESIDRMVTLAAASGIPLMTSDGEPFPERATIQAIAFVVSVAVCFLFTIAGAALVIDFFQVWAPVVLVNTISSFSFLTHFQAITSGVIDLRDLIFFASLITLFLAVNVVLIDLKKMS